MLTVLYKTPNLNQPTVTQQLLLFLQTHANTEIKSQPEVTVWQHQYLDDLHQLIHSAVAGENWLS